MEGPVEAIVLFGRDIALKPPYDTEETTPSLDSTPPHISTPGDALRGSLIDRHFTTGGTLKTTPPTAVYV